MLSSVVGVCSTAARGDFDALLPEAIIDDGRLLEAVGPRDVGRCCHERVPAREGAVATLGEGVGCIRGFDVGCGSSRGTVNPPSMISVGAPFVSQGTTSGLEGPDSGRWKDEALEKFSWMDISFPELMELGVPVLENVSLMGEIDLARSVPLR